MRSPFLRTFASRRYAARTLGTPGESRAPAIADSLCMAAMLLLLLIPLPARAVTLEDEVEAFVDRCMSIDNLIDIHSTAIRRRERGGGSGKSGGIFIDRPGQEVLGAYSLDARSSLARPCGTRCSYVARSSASSWNNSGG